MISKEQAYNITLNLLNSVWDAISEAAEVWERSPRMNLRMATANVQKALNEAISNTLQNASGFADGSPERITLEDIAARLEAFKSALVGAEELAPMTNAGELVSAWRIAVESIINNLMVRARETARIPAFGALAKRLAA